MEILIKICGSGTNGQEADIPLGFDPLSQNSEKPWTHLKMYFTWLNVWFSLWLLFA